MENSSGATKDLDTKIEIEMLYHLLSRYGNDTPRLDIEAAADRHEYSE